tara:strand:+ start:3047 stop:3247 length:201 start_codon:yes stop_codon:yes gene_type:complete
MTIFREINNLIQQDIDAVVDALSRGAAEDYPKYQYMVGKVEGMYHAKALIKDILTKNLDEVEQEDY